MKPLKLIAVVLCALALPLAASAHVMTDTDECKEGSDYIMHAAQSRESGITKEYFMDKFAEDMVMIEVFPPELRWFVQDKDDEDFLGGAARHVFDVPAQPEQHQVEFLKACYEHYGLTSGPDKN